MMDVKNFLYLLLIVLKSVRSISAPFDRSSSKAAVSGVGEIVDGVDMAELAPLHSAVLVVTGVDTQCLSVSPIFKKSVYFLLNFRYVNISIIKNLVPISLSENRITRTINIQIQTKLPIQHFKIKLKIFYFSQLIFNEFSYLLETIFYHH